MVAGVQRPPVLSQDGAGADWPLLMPISNHNPVNPHTLLGIPGLKGLSLEAVKSVHRARLFCRRHGIGIDKAALYQETVGLRPTGDSGRVSNLGSAAVEISGQHHRSVPPPKAFKKMQDQSDTLHTCLLSAIVEMGVDVQVHRVAGPAS